MATRNTFTSQYLATGCNSLVREIDDEMMNIHRFVVDLDAWKWWWPCFAETFWGEDVDSSLRSVTSTPRNSQSSLGKKPENLRSFPASGCVDVQQLLFRVIIDHIVSES